MILISTDQAARVIAERERIAAVSSYMAFAAEGITAGTMIKKDASRQALHIDPAFPHPEMH